MSESDNVSMGFPKRLYEDGKEPTPTKSINYRSRMEMFPRLQVFLGQELWDEVKGSPLGVVLRLYELQFVWCSRIVHNILTRQLVSRKKYELWFVIDNKPVRFTLGAFEEITGLNCEGAEDAPIGGKAGEFVMKLGLPQHRASPNLDELRTVLSSGLIRTREDKLRVAYLVIVASVIMGMDRRSPIPIQYVKLVNDLQSFEAYPWGKVGMRTLVAEVRKTDFSTYSYYIGGFLQVIQVWAYLLIPKLGHEFGFKVTDEGVPLLRYKGSKGKSASNTLGAIDISRQGLDYETNAWDDEVVDEHTDKLLKYYRQRTSVPRITWRGDAAVDSKVVAPGPKTKKRKTTTVEGEGSCGGKQRRLQGRSGETEDDGWRRGVEERLQRIEGWIRQMDAVFKSVRNFGESSETPPPKPLTKKPTPRKPPSPKPVKKRTRQVVKKPVPSAVRVTETEEEDAVEKEPSLHKVPEPEPDTDGTNPVGTTENETETASEKYPRMGVITRSQVQLLASLRSQNF